VKAGARQCLSLLWRYQTAYGEGNVAIRQPRIASELGRPLRSVQRWLSQLVTMDLISVEQSGPGAAEYFVKENGGALAELWRSKGRLSITEPSRRKTLNQSKRSATEPTPFSEAEKQTLQMHIEACNIDPTPELLARLARKAHHFGVTGFVIAAHIERARRKVQGTSNMPESAGWIVTVVENGCMADRERGVPKPKPVAVAHSPHAGTDDAGRYYGDSGVDMAALAARKRL